MAHWKVFDNEDDLLKDFLIYFKGKEEVMTNERITALALFRVMRTKEIVQDQEKAIKKLLKKYPIGKYKKAKLKKEFGL